MSKKKRRAPSPAVIRRKRKKQLRQNRVLLKNTAAALKQRALPEISLASRIIEARVAGTVLSRAAMGAVVNARPGTKGPVASLAEVGTSVESLMRRIPDEPGRRILVAYSPDAAVDLGRILAVWVHMTLGDAFRQGCRTPGRVTAASFSTRLRAEWRKYDAFLKSTRTAVRSGPASALGAILPSITSYATRSMVTVCRNAGTLAVGNTAEGMDLAVEASALARRYATLACAVVRLHQRMVSKRSKRAVAAMAKRARNTRRPFSRLVEPAQATRRTGATVGLTGTASSVIWHELPRKPYTTVGFTDTDTIVARMPFRSLSRRGVEPGSGVWAWGRIERLGTPPVATVKIAGESGSKHPTVWEDALANAAGNAYALYPAFARIEWTFPQKSQASFAQDILSRLTAAPG